MQMACMQPCDFHSTNGKQRALTGQGRATSPQAQAKLKRRRGWNQHVQSHAGFTEGLLQAESTSGPMIEFLGSLGYCLYASASPIVISSPDLSSQFQQPTRYLPLDVTCPPALPTHRFAHLSGWNSAIPVIRFQPFSPH